MVMYVYSRVPLLRCSVDKMIIPHGQHKRQNVLLGSIEFGRDAISIDSPSKVLAHTRVAVQNQRRHRVQEGNFNHGGGSVVFLHPRPILSQLDEWTGDWMMIRRKATRSVMRVQVQCQQHILGPKQQLLVVVVVNGCQLDTVRSNRHQAQRQRRGGGGGGFSFGVPCRSPPRVVSQSSNLIQRRKYANSYEDK
jgi:uncharacterized membrane protein YgcG